MLYKNLTVWQKSMLLVDNVYAVCRSFPSSERFGLWSLVTRSAVSVPSTIAEGSGRRAQAERFRFVSFARGSLYELSTPLEIAQRQGYCKVGEDMLGLIDEIAKMLPAMLSK